MLFMDILEWLRRKIIAWIMKLNCWWIFEKCQHVIFRAQKNQISSFKKFYAFFNAVSCWYWIWWHVWSCFWCQFNKQSVDFFFFHHLQFINFQFPTLQLWAMFATKNNSPDILKLNFHLYFLYDIQYWKLTALKNA